MQLGFMGLGQMGAAIAERLLRPDVQLHVYDPRPEAMAPFVSAGAIAQRSARDVADAAAIVFACLPTGAVSETVAAEAAQGRAVRTYVEMSTIGSPAMDRIAQSMARRDIMLLDCPISGGPKGARAGTLTVILAGSAAARDRVRPLLAQIGHLHEVGDRPGQGQLMKLVNNLVNAANMAAAFEALVLGAKGGLDPDQMVAVLNVSTGRNSATQEKVPRAVLTGTFDYGASLATMLKDVELGVQEAHALGVPMLVHGVVEQLWRLGAQQGMGEKDFTSLITLLERWAGTEVRSRRPGDGGSAPPGRD